ncbi:hypothetical protein A5752_05775 [Mycobacterium sp. 852002-51961_SCH5331710]|nr:hypothetical protein A5752_05775 [Mycobacterium sp. 852002-51961_SCH5331710]
MLATEPPATAATGAEQQPEAPSLDESGLDERTVAHIRQLRREAQHLRERARTAEGDNERLITQIGAMHHREIERLAAESLIDPSDIWQSGTTDFTDAETGELDPALVAEAARSLIADKPHLARPQSTPPPSDRPVEGLRSGAAPTADPTPKPSWSSAIRPHARPKGLG